VQAPSEFAKKDMDDMRSVLVRALRQDLLEQYRLSLIAKYDVKINDKLLTDMYTPKPGDAGDSEE